MEIDDLDKHAQGHIKKRATTMTGRESRRLRRKLSTISEDTLAEMKSALEGRDSHSARDLAPAEVFALDAQEFPYQPNTVARSVTPVGEQALRNGQVACVLVAGGQGTRLGYDGPKGCYPVLPQSGMTLFEVFFRKLKRVGQVYGRIPMLWIMVGDHNISQTREFLESHAWFGLDPENVTLFAQGELPAMDESGKMLLTDDGNIATSPDGHGGMLEAFYRSGAFPKLRANGVKVLSYFQVDNLQVPVVDPVFIGLHLSEGAEMGLKVVRKTDPSERVGIYCLDHGTPCIVEYTEFSDEQSAQRDSDGGLTYWGGSIAVHTFGVDFLARLAENGSTLPLHVAHKKVPHADDPNPDAPNAFKFERFIFDTIPLASKVVALEVPRDEQFLPLKNPDGPYGPDGVREAYQDYWRRAIKQATGREYANIEVDPLVFENARELIEARDHLDLPDGDTLRLTSENLK